MPISTNCPNCKALFRLPDELAGKKVKCQKCQGVFSVPSSDALTAAPGASVPSGADSDPETGFEEKPPQAPPTIPIMKVAEDDDASQEKPRRRRSSASERPAKSGSSSLPLVLALVGLGLFLCIGSAGVGAAFWFIGVRGQAQKKAFMVVGNKIDAPGKFDKGLLPDKAPEPIQIVLGADGVFLTEHQLNFQDSVSIRRKRHKLYAVHMEANRTYQIDLVSNQFDSYLYLIDDAGVVVMEDDDTGGQLNSRIIFRPNRTGAYRIEATSLGGQGVGNYTLTVRRN